MPQDAWRTCIRKRVYGFLALPSNKRSRCELDRDRSGRCVCWKILRWRLESNGKSVHQFWLGCVGKAKRVGLQMYRLSANSQNWRKYIFWMVLWCIILPDEFNQFGSFWLDWNKIKFGSSQFWYRVSPACNITLLFCIWEFAQPRMVYMGDMISQSYWIRRSKSYKNIVGRFRQERNS